MSVQRRSSTSLILSFLMALVISSGCRTAQRNQAVNSRPLKENPRVLILVRDKVGAAGLYAPGAGAAYSALFGLIGAGIYEAATYKSRQKQLPLVEKMSASGFPAYFGEQLREDLSHHPGWTVTSSSGLAKEDVHVLNLYLFSDKANAEERRQATQILDRYDEMIAADLLFYGVRVGTMNGRPWYDVEAKFIRFDLSTPVRQLWKDHENSRSFGDSKRVVDLKVEPEKDASFISEQLFQEGRVLSRWLAKEMGVSEDTLQSSPVQAPPAIQSKELKDI